MVRAPMYDKNGIKKGAWSRDEDEKLTSYIHRYGHWNWRLLPKLAGLKRCGKSCRLRWMNYLRPELKHGNFSGQEDALIIKLHEQFGNRWSTIAGSLPGRTDNEVKNRWHSHLKKKPRRCDEKDEPSTSCCGSDEGTQNSEGTDAQSSLITDTISKIILESSLVSPPTYSTTQLSSNVIEGIQDHTCFPSSAQSSTGDFWSQPFVADSFHQNGYLSSSENGGFEIYDDMYFDDLLYQLIQ